MPHQHSFYDELRERHAGHLFAEYCRGDGVEIAKSVYDKHGSIDWTFHLYKGILLVEVKARFLFAANIESFIVARSKINVLRYQSWKLRDIFNQQGYVIQARHLSHALDGCYSLNLDAPEVEEYLRVTPPETIGHAHPRVGMPHDRELGWHVPISFYHKISDEGSLWPDRQPEWHVALVLGSHP